MVLIEAQIDDEAQNDSKWFKTIQNGSNMMEINEKDERPECLPRCSVSVLMSSPKSLAFQVTQAKT